MLANPTSQTPKAQATAARIAEAAGLLFFTHGFDDTTIAQIAKSAGVAPGTVILHFGSKSALATAAFANEIRSAVSEALDGITAATATAQLAQLVGPLYSWYAKHNDVAPGLLQQALFADGPWASYYASTVTETVRAFAAIADQHLPDGADVLLTGEGFLADYLLVLLQGLRGDFDTVDAQVEHFVQLASTRIKPIQ